MELIGRITTDIIREGGKDIPTFIFQTKKFKEAYDTFKKYYISPLPVNVELFKELPTAPETIFPENTLIRLELAFEDPFPYNAYEINLSPDQVSELSYANHSSKQIRFMLEGKNGLFGMTKSVKLHDLHNYILDWHGVLGLYVLMRLSLGQLDTRQANEFINILKKHIAENGYATGIYTEIGLLYRFKDEFDKSIEYYIKEIAHSVTKEGNPGIGSMKAVNNLAVIYKKKKELAKALDLYKLAIHLNSNYFEAYLGISGLLDDYNLVLKCIARAYRIRPDDANIQTILHIVSEAYDIEEGRLIDELNMVLREVNLTKPVPELVINNPQMIINDL